MSLGRKEFVRKEMMNHTKRGYTARGEVVFAEDWQLCPPVISTLGAVEKLGVPGHLDGFQLPFIGFLRVILEVGQFDYMLVQGGESHCKRIEFWVRLGQQNADIFGVVPGELLWHESS